MPQMWRRWSRQFFYMYRYLQRGDTIMAKQKEWHCHFEGDIYLDAKNYDEAEEKAWTTFLGDYKNIIDLEFIEEMKRKVKEE